MESSSSAVRTLQRGVVIPACPLALTARRKLDERRQRALLRYYLAAGAGGVAVGVHTTQFAIRDPKVGLFAPVLRLAQEEFARAEARHSGPPNQAVQPSAPAAGARTFLSAKATHGDRLTRTSALLPPGAETNCSDLVRIAGVCGRTAQATAEAALVRACGYHAALLSLAAMKDANEDQLLAHCREVAAIIPLIGFYLQPAVGGNILPFSFWRRFAELQQVIAIKIAPFNRYQTLDVIRAVAESGRADIALYTGNDDNIVLDLLTPFRFQVQGLTVERRIVGGLLGHWAVWTRRAVELLDDCHRLRDQGGAVPPEMLRRSQEVTDANAALFDAANQFAGCIAGIHEVLRRQGLLAGAWCLDPKETLSPGQAAEIDRVCRSYPHLTDDDFVRAHLAEWLRG